MWNNETKNNRVSWLDVARTIAILSISTNHALTRAFPKFSDTGVAAWINILRSILYTFSRGGVLLFLMISGVLLLNKRFEDDKDVLYFYKHNLLGIVVTSEIWLFIMFWYRTIFQANNYLQMGWPFAIRRCLETLCFFNQETMGNMWYIPMIICVYLVIPFFGIAVKKLTNKVILIPTIVAMICGLLLPNINSVFREMDVSYSLDFELSIANMFSIYLIYVLVGYMISKGLLDNFSNIFLLVVFALSYTFCCAYQYSLYASATNIEFKYDFLPNVIAFSTLFELLRRRIHVRRIPSFVTVVSKISFGIFFVHIFFVSAMGKFSFFDRINPILGTIILEFFSIALSIIVIRVLSKITFFKKYLFLIKE